MSQSKKDPILQFRAVLMNQLDSWVKGMPDPNLPLPLSAADADSEPLTPRRLLEDVREWNEEGRSFTENMFDLAMENAVHTLLNACVPASPSSAIASAAPPKIQDE